MVNKQEIEPRCGQCAEVIGNVWQGFVYCCHNKCDVWADSIMCNHGKLLLDEATF